MKKEKVNELLKYTKSKKIIRILFLYNNEDLLDKVLMLYKNLYNTNRSDSQKSNLIFTFIRNRNIDHIDYLICNSQITNNYTFNEQKEIIKNYLSSKITYEQIVNECYMKLMNNKTQISLIKSDNKDKEHKKDKTIIKISSLITSNKNVLKYRSNEEIYSLIKEYYKDDSGVLINLIINENVLINRNNYEHIKLLGVYLDNPCDRVYDLIVNKTILKNMNIYDQLNLIDMYLDNPSENTYHKIEKFINKKDAYNKINNSINKDIKIYKNTLLKKENK